LHRLHVMPTIFVWMARRHDINDERATLVRASTEGKDIVASYGRLEPHEQVSRIHSLDAESSSLLKKMDALNARINRLYHWRNTLLIIAYLCFIAERIWTPYYH
ncbi:MAG TPA: hypothetical protein VK474_02640, partial [Chthoniobacterales bacterium]|nr:hypothetical protein [Chthoniobacterales bacterium]